MRQLKTFLLTAFITISAFSALIYSSCRKDKCKGIVCQNSGVCSNGSCSCPSGYSGANCEKSSILFVNDAFTPIYINVNGTNATIAVGGSVSFIATAGSAATVTAYTYGATSTGDQIGNEIDWSFSDYFPTGGNTKTEPLDVGNDQFYLYLINRLPSYVNSVQINSQPVDYISVPNDGYTYGLGYYSAGSHNVALYLGTSSGSYSWYPVSIPNMYNASRTFDAY